MGSLEPQGSGEPFCLFGGIMEEKGVNRQTGKWQYKDVFARVSCPKPAPVDCP